ncbi:hypothetical protein LUTEI9C_150013 [Luteimonas sp. 9C]|nr:hypothetical protein LUTEI9C_150013 [Luteimonas sp. 9C]
MCVWNPEVSREFREGLRSRSARPSPNPFTPADT